MSELQRYGRKALSTDNSSKAVGGGLIKASAAGGGLYLAASLIPFVSFLPLVIVLALVGGYLYLKD